MPCTVQKCWCNYPTNWVSLLKLASISFPTGCTLNWKRITAFISPVWGKKLRKGSAQREALAVKRRCINHPSSTFCRSRIHSKWWRVCIVWGWRRQKKHVIVNLFFIDGLFWTAGETLVKIISNHGGAFIIGDLLSLPLCQIMTVLEKHRVTFI